MRRSTASIAILVVGSAVCLEALPPPLKRSILEESGPNVRVQLLDLPSGQPLLNAPAKVSQVVQCESAPCRPLPKWEGTTDAQGFAALPRTAIEQGALIETPGHAALGMVTHVRRALPGHWTIALPRDGVGDGRIPAALVGRWRQSGWTLCRPVPTLGADEVAPPIQELIFQADGEFSVTWQPFEVYHDYRGTFASDARKGRIELTRFKGNFEPTDFAGRGTFSVAGDVLTLRGVWFGTKSARRTPDVCELTFARY